MWCFKTIEPGTPERNPRETEFFRLANPSEAVIREFIQNSLDARKNNENIVEVRISLGKVSKRDVEDYLDNNLKKHLKACGFLDTNEFEENVSYLILEDFGTTGLDGPFDPDSGKGNFYNFWWREGISEKIGRRAGRWGLGKITFHVVSKIRTFFALTVRDDKEVLLMGKTLLKTHKIDNERFQYFGYFSTKDSMPIKDTNLISNFKKQFHLTRNNEPGLSVVIPFPEDGIDFESMLKAVIQHYFYPILTGTLKVIISDNGKNKEIHKDSITKIASNINWIGTEWEKIDINEFFDFINAAIQQSPIELQIDYQNPEITPQSFKNKLEEIKKSFMNESPLKFEVPLFIKKDRKQKTYFIILLKRFLNFGKALEYYIRSGIIVTEHKTLGNRSVAALFIAEHDPICEFLGDCETPAHTTWNERTEGFKEKYENAIKVLRFIKKSILQIVSILDEPPRERQIDFLKEIFSIPTEESKEKMITSEPIVNINEGRSPLFKISKVEGGFKVSLERNTQLPISAIIKIAYDTYRGNPFRQYDKFDFDISESDQIKIQHQGCDIICKDLNILEVKITSQNFELKVTGFDPNRDLVIDITEKKNHETEI
ncbi:hypothetical protein DRP05_12810 [Archaeoglobales archaeon]|nr:MAG: hypothetical protein DRP05_12810 [Archaeoglobales archaeon]